MPIGDRDYVRGEHPPNCTCVDCVNRRLGIWAGRNKPNKSKKSRKETKPHRYKPQRKPISTAPIRSLWGKIKKLLIVLALFITTTITIVTVCKFVSGELQFAGFIIFLVVALVMVIWCLKSLSKYRVTFSRVFLVLLITGLFSVVASVYLDVRSIQDVQDSVKKALATETEQFRGSVDLLVQRAELKVIEVSETVGETGKETIKEIATTENVHINGGVLIGADGHMITLKNNPEAMNHSWEELKSFLLKDKTDEIPYDYDSFVCADFAERLHNNAEAAGIRAAYVAIQLGPSPEFPRVGGHALNAFETTDRGLVYIDCTGSSNREDINRDTIVNVEVGKEYIPQSIFPEPDWYWLSVGEILEIETIQW